MTYRKQKFIKNNFFPLEEFSNLHIICKITQLLPYLVNITYKNRNNHELSRDCNDSQSMSPKMRLTWFYKT